MRTLVVGTVCLLLLGLFSCVRPDATLADGESRLARRSDAPLGRCQRQYAEVLRLLDREREYQAEKARYAEALETRCTGAKWYDLGLLECALLVPVFGLFVPFFGFMLVGTLVSRRKSSTPGSIAEQTEIAKAR